VISTKCDVCEEIRIALGATRSREELRVVKERRVAHRQYIRSLRLAYVSDVLGSTSNPNRATLATDGAQNFCDSFFCQSSNLLHAGTNTAKNHCPHFWRQQMRSEENKFSFVEQKVCHFVSLIDQIFEN
jgi:hypothetical protein